MNIKKIAFVALIVAISGCAAKGPTEELSYSNKCYETTVNQKIEEYEGAFLKSDYVDLEQALSMHYRKVANSMLLKQRANDLSDPLGGIPAAFELESAQEEVINSLKPIYMVLSRSSVPQSLSTRIQQKIKDSLAICYGVSDLP